jgi:hypothetical protein
MALDICQKQGVKFSTFWGNTVPHGQHLSSKSKVQHVPIGQTSTYHLRPLPVRYNFIPMPNKTKNITKATAGPTISNDATPTSKQDKHSQDQAKEKETYQQVVEQPGPRRGRGRPKKTAAIEVHPLADPKTAAPAPVKAKCGRQDAPSANEADNEPANKRTKVDGAGKNQPLLSNKIDN